MAADTGCKALTKLIDITECCICLKTFADPRMLPCIHTFCLQCLQDMVNKTDKKPGNWIQCPVCRKEFTLPNDGVKDVQKNFFMTSLIEVRNTLNQSKIESPLCDICKENSKLAAIEISEATVRCLVCMENLCSGCLQQHNTFKLMRNHEILNLGNPVLTEETAMYFKVVNCDNHRGKVLDYYCAECKKVVCVSCFVENHRAHDCKDVATVEDEFRKIINCNAKMISSLAEEVLSKKRNRQVKEGFLKKMVEREQDILQRSEEFKKLIDQHTQSLLSSLNEIKNRHLKEIQTEEDEMERRVAILESFSRYCEELGRNGSASDVCRSKDELLRRADELEDDHEKYIMLPNVSFGVTFQATDLDKLLEITKGNLVGSVKENVVQLEECAVTFSKAEDSAGLHVYKIKLRGQSEITSSIQTSCLSTGAKFPAAAVYGCNLFVVGLGKLLNEIWKYSFTSSWKKAGCLVQGRDFHCAAFIDETLYICGGSNGHIFIDNIEAYNAFTEKTTIAGKLIFGTEFSASVAYKGSIYVFGGEDKHNKYLDSVQIFSPVSNTCTLLSTSMPRSASCLRAVLWNTFAILQETSACFIFDFEKETWQERQNFLPNGGFCLFGMVLENERIFIIGGICVEVDAHGNEMCIYKDDVMYIRALNIVNDEASKWKTCCKMSKPIAIIATVKL